MRIPMGRKNRRSAHSSTACPLCERSFCGFTEHLLQDREGRHRLVLGDHERGDDAHIGVVDHREHPAHETGVEDTTRGLLGVQLPTPRDATIYGAHVDLTWTCAHARRLKLTDS